MMKTCWVEQFIIYADNFLKDRVEVNVLVMLNAIWLQIGQQRSVQRGMNKITENESNF